MQMLVTSTILVFFVVFRHRVRVEVIFPFPRRVRVFRLDCLEAICLNLDLILASSPDNPICSADKNYGR